MTRSYTGMANDDSLRFEYQENPSELFDRDKIVDLLLASKADEGTREKFYPIILKVLEKRENRQNFLDSLGYGREIKARERTCLRKNFQSLWENFLSERHQLEYYDCYSPHLLSCMNKHRYFRDFHTENKLEKESEFLGTLYEMQLCCKEPDINSRMIYSAGISNQQKDHLCFLSKKEREEYEKELAADIESLKSKKEETEFSISEINSLKESVKKFCTLSLVFEAYVQMLKEGLIEFKLNLEMVQLYAEKENKVLFCWQEIINNGRATGKLELIPHIPTDKGPDSEDAIHLIFFDANSFGILKRNQATLEMETTQKRTIKRQRLNNPMGRSQNLSKLNLAFFYYSRAENAATKRVKFEKIAENENSITNTELSSVSSGPKPGWMMIGNFWSTVRKDAFGNGSQEKTLERTGIFHFKNYG